MLENQNSETLRKTNLGGKKLNFFIYLGEYFLNVYFLNHQRTKLLYLIWFILYLNSSY